VSETAGEGCYPHAPENAGWVATVAMAFSGEHHGAGGADRTTLLETFLNERDSGLVEFHP
jgi:hypothetical protein